MKHKYRFIKEFIKTGALLFLMLLSVQLFATDPPFIPGGGSVDAGTDATICEGDTHTCSDAADGGGTTILWTATQGSFTDASVLNAEFDPGTYTGTVTLTLDVDGTQDTKTITVGEIPEVVTLTMQGTQFPPAPGAPSAADISGDLANGYVLCSDGASNYLLDINTLTTTNSVVLKENEYNAFYIDETTVPSGSTAADDYYKWWEAKGVTATLPTPDSHMWKIIQGNEPMFYLRRSGTDYQLLDGYQHDINSSDVALILDGSTPPGLYNFDGTVLSEHGCESSSISISTRIDAPAVSDLELQVSSDNSTFSSTAGDYANGFFMCKDADVAYYYFDISSITANFSIKESNYNGFYLDQTALPTDFTTYWNNKGVNASATSNTWQEHMYKIITGAEPMAYLLYDITGPNEYRLIDGLYRDFFNQDVTFKMNGDYPSGNYDLDGAIESEYGCSTEELTISLEVETPILSDAILQVSTDGTNWNQGTLGGDFATGFTICLDPSSTTDFYLGASSMTIDNATMKQNEYNAFYLETPAATDTAFYNWWDAKGVNATATSGTWQEHMWQIIQGNEAQFYAHYDGTDYMLVDGLQRDFAMASPDQHLKLNGDYPYGEYTYTGSIMSTNGCTSSDTSIVLTVIHPPIAKAGDDATICEDGSHQLAGVQHHGSTYLWSASTTTGSFDDATSLTATYTPGATEISNGTVNLTLTVQTNSNCNYTEVADAMTLTIQELATADAGSDATICSGSTHTLSGSAQNHDGVTWTTSGTGSFDDDTDLGATYTPSQADITAGSVTLTLTATDITPCPTSNKMPAPTPPATNPSTMTLTIHTATATAGSDYTVCDATSYTLGGNQPGTNETGTWTYTGPTGGTVTWIGGTTLNTYNAQAQVDVAGEYTFTWKVKHNSITPDCAATDDVAITFLKGTNADGYNITTMNDIDALTGAPIVAKFSYNLPSPDTKADNNIMMDGLLTLGSGQTFPQGATVKEIRRVAPINKTWFQIAAPDLSGKSKVWFGDLLGATNELYDNALNNYSWEIIIAGIDEDVDLDVTFSLVTYITKPTDLSNDCYGLLDSETKYLKYNTATIAMSSDTVTTCYDNGSALHEHTFTATMVYPTLSNLDVNDSIKMNSKIDVTGNLLANANLFWGYNAAATIPSATPINGKSSIYLSEIVGTKPAPITGHSGLTDVWYFKIVGSDEKKYDLDIEAITQTAIVNPTTNPLTVNGVSFPTYTSSDIDTIEYVYADSTIVLNFQPHPTAFAGQDQSLCETETVELSGTSSNAASVLWTTSGDGSFQYAGTDTAKYTFGNNDLTNGNVNLTYTATAISPCTTAVNAYDGVAIEIFPTAHVDAGSDDNACRSETEGYQLNGSVSYGDPIFWTTWGDGTFDDASSLTAIYYPGTNDLSTGSVTLELFAVPTNDLYCSQIQSDQVVITYYGNYPPSISAGNSSSDFTGCSSGSYTFSDANGNNYIALAWTTLGDGSFDDNSLLNPTYTPGQNDISAGYVDIKVEAVPHSSSPCVDWGEDEVRLYFNDPATATSGTNQTICLSGGQISGFSATNFSDISWASTGDGTFEYGFCTPESPQLNGFVGVTNFVFGDISNSTTYAPDGYGDYSSMSTILEQDSAYTMVWETSHLLGTMEMWIDMDGDGYFSDIYPDVYEEVTNLLGLNNTSVYIPTGYPGEKRLRIRVRSLLEQNSGPCDDYTVGGETEDYTVYVKGSGTPTVYMPEYVAGTNDIANASTPLTVTLSATSYAPCTSVAQATSTLNFHAAPSVLFAANGTTFGTGEQLNFCEGESIALTLDQILTGNSTSYDFEWTVNDGTNESTGTAYGISQGGTLSTSSTLAVGTHTVQLTYAEGNDGCEILNYTPYTATFVVNPSPTFSSVSVDEQNVCYDGTVSFTLTGLVDGSNLIKYTVNNGSTDELKSETIFASSGEYTVSHSASQYPAGNYTITIDTLDINGCILEPSANNSFTFNTHAEPAVIFAANNGGSFYTDDIIEYCYNETIAISLNDVVSGTDQFSKIKWTVNGTDEDSALNVSTTVNAELFSGQKTAGDYIVQITEITDVFGCTPSSYAAYKCTVRVHPEPAVIFEANEVAFYGGAQLDYCYNEDITVKVNDIVNVNGPVDLAWTVNGTPDSKTGAVEGDVLFTGTKPAGEYIVNITSIVDENGCSPASYTAYNCTITVHPEPAVIFEANNVPFYGGAQLDYLYSEDITVKVNDIMVVNGPVDLAWTVNGTPDSKTGAAEGDVLFSGQKAPGTYIVNITSIVDENGCSPASYTAYNCTITVHPEPAVIFEANNVPFYGGAQLDYCYNEDITVKVNDIMYVNGPVDLAWTVNGTPDSKTGAVEGDVLFTGTKPAGEYIVNITSIVDENGYSPASYTAYNCTITVHPEPAVIFEANDVAFYGGAQLDYCYNEDITVKVNDIMNVNGPVDLAWTVNGTPDSKTGAAEGDVLFTGTKPAGEYIVNITSIVDENGCSPASYTAYNCTITVHPEPAVIFEENGTPFYGGAQLEYCYNEDITVKVNDIMVVDGPVDLAWTVNGTPDSKTGAVEGDVLFTGTKPAGEYIVNITSIVDENGCSPASYTAYNCTITVHPEPAVIFEANEVAFYGGAQLEYCYNEDITVKVNDIVNVNGPVDLAWTVNGTPDSKTGAAEGDVLFTGTKPVGEYIVNITSIVDENGCSPASYTAYNCTITVHPEPAVIFEENGTPFYGGAQLEYCYNEDITVKVNDIMVVDGPVDLAWTVNGTPDSKTGAVEGDVLFTGTKPAGEYIVNITSIVDENGCSPASYTAYNCTITVHPEPAVIFEANEVAFYGGAQLDYCYNEDITVKVNDIVNVNGPVDLAWTVNGTPDSKTGAAEGDVLFTGTKPVGEYIVNITSIVDENGCSPASYTAYNCTITVHPEPAVIFEANNVPFYGGAQLEYCYNEDITVKVNDIMVVDGPVDLAWTVNGTPDSKTGAVEGDVLFTGTKPAGEYIVNITSIVDENGCSPASYTAYNCTITVHPEPAVIFEANNVPFYGGAQLEYCYNEDITVKVNDIMVVDGPVDLAWTVNGTPDSKTGAVEGDVLFTGTKPAGEYIVNITSIVDENGCSPASYTAYNCTITVHPEPAVIFEANEVAFYGGAQLEYCYNEDITVKVNDIMNVNGPVDLAWTVNGTPDSKTGAVEGDVLFTGTKPAGEYIVNITSIVDENGCSPASYTAYNCTITVNEEPMVSFDFNGYEINPSENVDYCEGDDVTVKIMNYYGGTAPYDIEFSVTGPSSWNDTGDDVVTGTELFNSNTLAPGVYTVAVTSLVDANGCPASATNLALMSGSVTINAKPVVSDFGMVSSLDGQSWDALVGSYANGFNLCPDGNSQTHYMLNVANFSANVALEANEMNEFFLDVTSVGTDYYPYWANRGVDANATGGWEAIMWQIINGNAPIAYLVFDGTDYMLVDGLQYQYAQQVLPLVLPGDYPHANYKFDGTLLSDEGCAGEEFSMYLRTGGPELQLSAAGYTIDNGMIYVMDPNIVLQAAVQNPIAPAYAWNTGSTQQILPVSDFGTYTVTATDMGCQAVASVEVSEIQEIELHDGWGWFSTYINTTADFNTLMADLMGADFFLKDQAGNSFFNIFGVTANGLPPHEVGKAYQYLLLTPETLVVYGSAVAPETVPVSLDAGWNSLGYLRKATAPVADMMSPVLDDLELLKDETGLTYWPLRDPNTGSIYYIIDDIHNIAAGDGFQIKMLGASTLTYPANAVSFAKASGFNPVTFNFGTKDATGNNMTLGIPETAWEDLEVANGDEVGIFSSTGQLVGSGVYENDHMAISLWGDDELDDQQQGLVNGEMYTIKLWNSRTDKVSTLEVTEWTEGDGTYGDNATAIVGKLAIQIDSDLTLGTYPNPFSDVATIEFSIPEDGKVKVELLNAAGKLVEVLADREYVAGEHTLTLKANDLAIGNYFIRLTNNDQTVNTAVQLVK